MKTYTQQGITFFDPADVKQARKDQYWLDTAQAMEARGLYECAITFAHLDTIKKTFASLPEEERLSLLQIQRLTRRAAFGDTILDTSRLLRWSTIKDGLIGNLEDGKKLLETHTKTAHSYINLHIRDVFQDNSRLYLPLDQFVSPENKDKAKNDLIVLSRHPYDLMRCSSFRGWSSCMHFKGMNYSHYIARDIKHGTIAAYHIQAKEDDWRDMDWNIERPAHRILIKPYREPQGTLLYIHNTTYGDHTDAYYKEFSHAAHTICRTLLSREAVIGRRYQIDGVYHIGAPEEHILDDRYAPIDPLPPKTDFLRGNRVYGYFWNQMQKIRNRSPN